MSVETKSNKTKWIVLAAIAIVFAAGAVSAFTIPGMGKGEKLKAVNGTIVIPVSNVSDGKAHFFRVNDGGKEIRFFVVKGSDGAIHTAFDACDVCFHEKKGYVQQGDAMVCKNCSRKFAINRIGSGSGSGCNPSYLNSISSQDRKRVVISVADLKAGARFF